MFKQLTWHEFSGIHQAWADGHEQKSLLFVQRVVLGNGTIESCFTDGIRSSNSDLALIDKINIRHGGRQCKDLLLLTFTKERDKGVDRIDHADDISLETDPKVLVQGLWVIGAVALSATSYLSKVLDDFDELRTHKSPKVR